jgi:T5SS/PEP-CTERM-associated repeat protein
MVNRPPQLSLDTRDTFTSFFEFTQFYFSNGTPLDTINSNGTALDWPFYFEQKSATAKASSWNFGYGVNLTLNYSTYPPTSPNSYVQILFAAGVPNSVIDLLTEAITNTPNPTLGRVPTAPDINQALSPTTNWQPAAQVAEDAFYQANDLILASNLAAQGINLSALPDGVQLALEDIAYNQGPLSSAIFGNTAKAGKPVSHRFLSDLQNGVTTGDFSAAAFELAFGTAQLSSTLALARGFANAVRILGFTVVINTSDNTISQVLGDVSQSQLINFLEEMADTPSTSVASLATFRGKPAGGALYSALADYTMTNGYYVTQPGDTFTSIAAAIEEDATDLDPSLSDVTNTASLIAAMNGGIVSNVDAPLPAGQTVAVPISVYIVGASPVTINQALNWTYFYYLATDTLVATSTIATGLNANEVTLINAAGDQVGYLPAGSISQITQINGVTTFNLVGGVTFDTNSEGSMGSMFFVFGGKQVPVPADATVRFISVGDPTYVVEADDPSGTLVDQISYGSDGIDELTTYDEGQVAGQDIEYANDTSVITSDSVTTDYSGPDGTGTVLNPTYISNYHTYVWVGGDGAFADVGNWSVLDYNPDADPPEPMPQPPGSNTNVTFALGGVITGPGNAQFVVVAANITFMGVIEADNVYNSGFLDIPTDSLILGSLQNVGQLSIEGDVEGSQNGGLGNSGFLSISQAADVSIDDFDQTGGSAAVLAGSMLNTVDAVVGGGVLTVDGLDAILTASGNIRVDYDTHDGSDGRGSLILSDQGQLVANSLSVGDYSGVGSPPGGSVTIETGGTATILGDPVNGGVDVVPGSSVLIDGAGAELNANEIQLETVVDFADSDDSSATLAVLNGGTVATAQLDLGSIISDDVAPGEAYATIDGIGSELDLSKGLSVYSGTITVADGATLDFGAEVSAGSPGTFYTSIDVGDTALTERPGFGNLNIESGGQLIAESLPDNSQTALGAFAGDQGNAIVTGTKSLLDLGDAPLIVGSSGTGDLTISDGGEVDAGTIEVAQLLSADASTDGDESAGLITVEGTNSLLFADSLNLGFGGPGTLSIVDGGVASVSDGEVLSGGVVILAGGAFDADALAVIGLDSAYGSGGVVSGYGTLSGEITDYGAIVATGGLLDLTGDLSGTGTLMIANGATLEVDGSLAPSVIVTFGGPDAVLNLGTSATGIGSLSALGDSVAAVAGDTVTDTLTVGLPPAASGDMAQAAALTADGTGTTVNETGALIVYSGTATVSRQCGQT